MTKAVNFNKYVYVGLLFGALAAFATKAMAIPFSNVVNPEPNITITTTTPYSYNHTIAGYDPLLHSITDALLEVVLSDDGGPEQIRYNLESNIFNQNNTGNAAQTYSFDLGDLGILATLSDGVLNITLSAVTNAYIFNHSTLSGNYSVLNINEPDLENPIDEETPIGDSTLPTGVPVPAAGLFFGLGLAALALSRRRG